MPQTYKIHALHGFLGQPGDWTPLKNVGQFHAHDFFNHFPIRPFTEWAEQFNGQVNEGQNILLGYSLGGRLGLHALLQAPEKWKAAIFLSTHPGLNVEEEKIRRIKADKGWAERFEKEPWEDLMEDWNGQDVFHSSLALKRKESDNNRSALSAALNIWSLGFQEDLSERIAVLNTPICWMVGENDHKYVQLAQKLKFKHPKSTLCMIPEGGHRFLFEQPQIYESKVIKFIENLE